MSTTYGYARVSSRDQKIDRQLDALLDQGLVREHIFIDRQSGKDFERPAYRRLTAKLRPGDLLILKSIDRLGRNYDEILTQWRVLTKERGIDILVLDMPLLDTRERRGSLTGTFVADLVLQILSYVAQAERESIHQRQAEGIAAAKRRGVHFGAVKMELPEGFPAARRRYLSGELSVRRAAALCGMNYSTFYQRCREAAPERRG